MPRAKSSVASRRRRKKILRQARGYWGARSRLYRTSVDSVHRAWRYAYRDRRTRKRDFRRLWIIRINAMARENGMSYSRFMSGLTKAGVTLDRRMLADLAVSDPAAFARLADQAREHAAGAAEAA